MIRNSKVNLIGIINTEPKVIDFNGKSYYTFDLKILRLSGAHDNIPVMCLVDKFDYKLGDRVEIYGDYRSYNVKGECKTHLKLIVVVKNIYKCKSADKNEIEIVGFVCKPPVHRVTPNNRTICEVHLAINGYYSRSTYIPCIVWGNAANECKSCEIGTKIMATGRIQSREYKKALNDKGDFEMRIAYEVSISTIETLLSETPGM